MKRIFSALLAAALFAVPAVAHEYSVGNLVVGHPWSRPTAPGMPMGVAYLSITNNGPRADALVGATTSVASRIEFHQTTLTDGMARMRPMREIVIDPGKTVRVEPGGIHLMLVGLEAPLATGARVPLRLTFREAGAVDVELTVESRDPGVAESESDLTRGVGTVMVVGRRASSLPTHIPATVVGITGEAVERGINAFDAEDALKYFPSLTVRKRYIGDYDHAVLASRASGTNNSARSLVYADGILLSNLLGNGATFTPRWGLVTPEEIARVDVLYGPFSAAYPGNSVGAVVDYVTRMPEEFEARAAFDSFVEDFDVYGTRESYSGWQASASVGDSFGREGHATAWWLNVNRLDSVSHPIAFATRLAAAGPVGTGGTPVSGALAGRNPRNQDWWLLGATNVIDTVQDHAKIKLAHDFGEHVHASYTLGYWRNAAGRRAETWLRDAAGAQVWSGPVNVAGRVYDIGPPDFAPSSGDLEHLMHGLSVRRRALGAWDLEGAASLYDYHQDVARSATVAMPAAATGGAGRIADQSGTGWSTLALRARRHSRGSGAHLLELGLQYDDYRLRSVLDSTTDWRRGPRAARVAAFGGKTNLASLYAQDTFEFAGAWRATLGLRLEHWRASDGTLGNATQTRRFPERDDTHVSPKLALAWALNPTWSFESAVGRAVRLPTVSELFQGSLAANAIVNNDPDLAPERSWTTELAAVCALDHADLRATAFHEDTRDALYSQVNVAAGATVTTIQNVGLIRTNGLELAARARPHDTLELDASLTWTRSRIAENDAFPASEGRRQPRVPEWRANALLTWRPAESFSATLGARYGGRQYNTLDNSDPHGASYTGTSRFLVADARLRFTHGRWSAALGVDNLGNERYWAFHPYSRRTYNAGIATTL